MTEENQNTCQFCEKKRNEKQLIKGMNGAICERCLQMCNGIWEKKMKKDEFKHHPRIVEPPYGLKIKMDIKEVEKELDKWVIGQEVAKKQLLIEIYKHINQLGRKNNVFLYGPSGVGKTHLVRTMAQMSGVPFLEVSATSYSETGYKGKEVDDIIQELSNITDGNISKMEKAIVFIDEIDKTISSTNESFSPKVQQSLLKMVEGVPVSFRGKKANGTHSEMVIDTTNILFVVAGACVGLKEQIEDKYNPKQIGFGLSSVPAVTSTELTGEDLIDYGFLPEFIGRFPLIVELNPLSEEEVFHYLLHSESSLLKEATKVFDDAGISLTFTDGFMSEISKKVIRHNLGIRSVQHECTKLLNECLYEGITKGLTTMKIDERFLTKENQNDIIKESKKKVRSSHG